MMFGGYHERYDHSDQFLLLGSEAGTIQGWSTIRLVIGQGDAGSNPDELAR